MFTLKDMAIGKKNSEEEKNLPEEKNLFQDNMNWESTRFAENEKSKNRAWRIVYALIFLSCLLTAGFIFLLPLKENTPYLLREDPDTGALSILTTLDINKLGFVEVRDNHWLTKYVLARESYNWHTIQKDYDLVGILSSKKPAKDYLSLYDGDNPLDKKYGSKIIVLIEIASVVPNEGIATVRFKKTIKHTDESKTQHKVSKWVATIGYSYSPDSVMTQGDRLINPYGFRVDSYRIDQEMGK